MRDEQLKFRLSAISLLDGRNWDKVRAVSDYFSEFALIKYRLRVEIAYLIFLSTEVKIVRPFAKKEIDLLNNIWQKFQESEGCQIKEIEKKINHDVKAVEYFLREKLAKTSLSDISEFIHFGLTSYDVNIPSYGLMIADFRKEVLIPTLSKLFESLKELIKKTKLMPMLGRTHGQPALPTTMGKELAVYYKRIRSETDILANVPIEAKLTGAVGNFNALDFTAPDIDWISLSKKFIRSLSLVPNIFTTQIIPYDSWLRLFDSIKRLNNILLGFSQDIWWYISFEYFLQKKKEEEVGSSTMAHKINPITFENAEGNLGIANSLFEFFIRKLAISRLQRDLSDSTVKRDFGLAFGFTLLAWDSILSGLSRISPNAKKMREDLDSHWEIFSEGIQTYLRFKNYKNAYEMMKEKTRGMTFTRAKIHELIDSLSISSKDKKYLKIESLNSYLGKAVDLVDYALQK
jgi:adenylosuccinate lyase